MKLGTLNRGGPDGKLVVVSRDRSLAIQVPKIAPTLQAAFDDWQQLEPELRSIYRLLNEGHLPGAFALDRLALASPLPRAYQWADGSAYVNHVELVRRARGSELPESYWTDPLMYQGGSDGFLGPTDNIPAATEDWGIDFEAEIAIITDNVPMGIRPEDAGYHIKLFMLVNDVSLRGLIPEELGKGFGFFQSKPASAFSPVAVTPDELGGAWDGHKIHLPLVTHFNGEEFGRPNAGVDMTWKSVV